MQSRAVELSSRGSRGTPPSVCVRCWDGETLACREGLALAP